MTNDRPGYELTAQEREQALASAQALRQRLVEQKTENDKRRARRRLDVAGLVLLIVGLVCGVLAYWTITAHGVNALILVPSVVAATIGASNIAKREAPRA